jgi:SSS family solute:Na+ symporter
VKDQFPVNGVAIAVFCGLFLLVTVLGFVAARWRRGNLDLIDEWGLGERCFGTVVTWFLLGGDLFTAHTFIAIPALVWAVARAASSRCPTRSLSSRSSSS